MALWSWKDKNGVTAFLYTSPKDGLHIVFRIAGNHLKFIDGNDTRFVCLPQIVKDLVECRSRGFDVTYPQSPLWYAIDVKGDGAS